MTRHDLLRLPLRRESDPLAARQQARCATGHLGFSGTERTRVATAVSEVARACIAGGGGELRIALFLDRAGHGALEFAFTFASDAPDPLAGSASARLVDGFQIGREDDHTVALLAKQLPRAVSAAAVAKVRRALVQETARSAQDELQQRHEELLSVLADLQSRQDELRLANQELADTNRGVLALYAELDDRAEQLRHANRLKDQFISYLSHEFRTPLNSMSMLSKMLLNESTGAISEEQATQVRLIRKSALDLLEMVNDLLDLAKIEAGKLDVNVEPVDLAEVFSALRGMMRPLTPSDRVDLVLEDPWGLPRLLTDPFKLGQILRNLISNALKFTVEGEVRVSARSDGTERIVFAVEDTGIGIPPAEQERIFAEFEQVNTPLQRKVRGTGLGLSLSRRLAKLLGGRLELESEPGKGSIFRLVLPLSPPGAVALEEPGPAAPAEAPVPVEAAATPGSLYGARVLVIDDDLGSRYIAGTALRALGAEVVEAESGMAGIDVAIERPPALIVLDLRMPGMDGFEVLRVLEADPRTRDVPVVINTSKQLEPAEFEDLRQRTAGVVLKDAMAEDGVRALVSAVARVLAS